MGLGMYNQFQFLYETIFLVTAKWRHDPMTGKPLISLSIKRPADHLTFLNFLGSHFSGAVLILLTKVATWKCRKRTESNSLLHTQNQSYLK